MALPDPTLPFEVVTDACQTGLGAVLLQEGKPIAFTGRLLTPAEQRYTTTEQELLAVVFALSQWRCYLQGAQHDFTLVTDHHPNTYFATQPNLSRRQARWSEKLQDYHLNWQYCPGKQNIADPVSRSPALPAQHVMLSLTACLHELSWPPFEWVQHTYTQAWLQLWCYNLVWFMSSMHSLCGMPMCKPDHRLSMQNCL